MLRSQFLDHSATDNCTLLLPGAILPFPCIISLIGAGGKTTTLFRLGQWLKAQGLQVLITTTTKMFLPDPAHYDRLLLESCPDLLFQHLKNQPSQEGITYCALSPDAETGKVSGLRPEQVDEIFGLGRFHVILVEADGAKGKSLKAPAAHEPCIPSLSHAVIALTGYEMIQAEVQPEQLHRWDCFTRVTGIQPGEKLNRVIFQRLINHPEGMFKGTPLHAKRIWLINRHSHTDASLTSFIEWILQTSPLLTAIWLGAMLEVPSVHLCLTRHSTHISAPNWNTKEPL